ncbi:MAG: EAL domain-containing protein [Nitrosomonas sp.]|uniref:sensor domain-containing phosphodiesterase n=2 Tax=Nitrosomonas TaxID=914 RepID=UPI00260B8CE8|nr:EAL domain-containing protein [uncultured Nitrosomonas sp.]MCC6915836.1 EAL domain-containing protein [Nitrosomonas sp.]
MAMRTTSKISAIKPFLSAMAAVVVMALLIALDHSLITTDSYIVAGLWVILLAAILVMIVQIAHTEKVFAKQFAQLAAQKERLANEIKYRLWAEKTSSESKAKLQIVDENFPVMLAYFSTEQQCQYHNRAFRQWFGLRSEQVENRFLKEFFNQSLFFDIGVAIERVLSGETVQNQYVQQLANQSACLVTGHFMPHFDSAGRVIGFYMLYTPRLMKKGEILPQNMGDQVAAWQKQLQGTKDTQISGKNTDQQVAWVSVDFSKRIIQAIEQNEFHLYCQSIVAARSDQEVPICYEVLIRMAEEESNLIPPGAFLPFVEKYNLMPRLDKWVAEKIIHYIAKQKQGSRVSFGINLARSTLNDPLFADHIRQLLNAVKIEPGKLCFEIETADAMDNLQNTAQFVKKLRQSGCLISLCSFNHDRSSFDLLKHIRADFLKIDGSLICNILRDAEDLKKVENISKFAHALKIGTIGELVETQDIRERLAKIGIDYIQGFLVGCPFPIEEIQ